MKSNVITSLVSVFSYLNRFGLHTNQLEQMSNCLKPIYLVLCLETVISLYLVSENQNLIKTEKKRNINLFLSFKSI